MSDIKKDSEQKAYETSDAKFRAVLWAGAGLVALMVATFALMLALLKFFETRQQASMAAPPPLAEIRPLPPAPRLQVTPELDWEHFHAEQDSLANSYGWVSKEAGVVRIPVERAMELMLKRGFPARESEIENPKPKIEGRGSKIEDGDVQ